MSKDGGKSTKIDLLTEDRDEIENLKNESLTALALYNLIFQFYQEEGARGLEYLNKMWKIVEDETKNLRNN